jgi:hypothetical protein
VLEVHPPHHTASSWRDFFIHIGTITLGLFIALSLEGALEAMHHRHLVHESRENIHREIEQNEQLAKDNIAYIQEDLDRMNHNTERVRDLRANPHALDNEQLNFNTSWIRFNESAWRSAHESSVLTYMPTAEVQRYTNLYVQQEAVTQQLEVVANYQFDTAALFFMEKEPSQIHPDDVQTLLRNCSVTRIRLSVLKSITEQLHKSYTESLQN